MNIKICDVCYHEGNRIVFNKSTHKITWKSPLRGLRLALDVCLKHNNYFKVCKTFDEASKKYEKLTEY